MTGLKCTCGAFATHYVCVLYVTKPYDETEYLDRYVCEDHATPESMVPPGTRYLESEMKGLPPSDLPEHALPELKRIHSGYECWRKDLDAHGLVTANLMHPEND